MTGASINSEESRDGLYLWQLLRRLLLWLDGAAERGTDAEQLASQSVIGSLRGQRSVPDGPTR